MANGQRCMGVNVGSKHLARIQGDDAPRHVTAVLLWLPDGDDSASAYAHHTLDTLDLEPVDEGQLVGSN